MLLVKNVEEPEINYKVATLIAVVPLYCETNTAKNVIQQSVVHVEIDDIVEASISVEDSSTVLKRDQNQPTSTGSGNKQGRDIQNNIRRYEPVLGTGIVRTVDQWYKNT